MESVQPPPRPIRITRASGNHFLVFDQDSAAWLRRNASVNGNLVGTAPQQPTQNVFLGLPVEIRPEDASALVAKGFAWVMDDSTDLSPAAIWADPQKRAAYIEQLQSTREAARKDMAENQARRAAEVAGKQGKPSKKKKNKQLVENQGVEEDGESLFSSAEKPRAPIPAASAAPESFGLTLTASMDLTPVAAAPTPALPPGALVRHLQDRGYFMTPGLRFGAKYSVYPGDPLRFHAHFMANEYAWDEPIPIMDIVEGGRLATAVKKAFLVGGQEPAGDDAAGAVRTYSIEWAAM